MPIMASRAAAAVHAVRPAIYSYFVVDVTANAGDGTYLAIDDFVILSGATEYPTSPMTSASAPSPLVAFASSNFNPNNSEYRAFDHAQMGSGFCWVTAATTTGYLGIYLGALITPTGFKLRASDTPLRSPAAGSFKGSVNGVDYTTLKTFSGQTGWSSGEWRTFTI